MASLLFPDAGSRRAEDNTGRPAANKAAVVYANSDGDTLAEIYTDSGGSPGALIATAQLTTDSYGFLPLFWGPADGTDKLWISVNAGPVWPVDADNNARLDALEAGSGGGGSDPDAVKLVGDQTVAGIKTFTSPPILPAPVQASHAATRAFVETSVAAEAANQQAVSAAIGGRVDTLETAAAAAETQVGAQTKADAAQAAATAAALQKSANLADVASLATTRTNLGLGTAALVDVGTTAGTVAAGNDSRLSDARTPIVHAATHASAGTDPVTVVQSQVSGLPAALDAKADLVGGKIPSSQIPDLVVNATYPVASEAEMLAAAAGVGDLAIRTDLDPAEVYILADTDPTDIDNWILLNLAGTVVSVNGQSGAVTLTAADLGAATSARTITAGTGLVGGGNLTADRTITADVGTTAGTLAAGDDSRIVGAAAAARTIATTAPLAGGGDLTANRTLTVANATTGTVGVVQLAGDLAGTATAPTIATAAVTSTKIADGTIVDGDINASANIAQSKIAGLTTAIAAKVDKGALVYDVRDYGAVGDGTTDDKAAIVAAFAAAELAGGRRVVFLPAGVHAVSGTLSLSGYSSVLQGVGAHYGTTGVGATGSVLKATTQTGPVLDLNGWVQPQNFHGHMKFARFAIQGDNTADPTLAKSGLAVATNGTAVGSVTFEDLSITKTGGPALDIGPVYLADFNRIVVGTPVSAKANNVPYIRVRGANGNRFIGIGLRSITSSADVGVDGAIDINAYAPGGASGAPSNNLWLGTWFEFLHMPTNGCLWSLRGNAHIIEGTQWFDCGKESGATNTCFVRVAEPATGNSYGANTITGLIPGDGGSGSLATTGILVQQSRNRIVGVKGYNGANVTLDPGVDYTYAELGGAESGVAGPAAFVNNSGTSHNVLIDHVSDYQLRNAYQARGQTSGPQFENPNTPANGGVWLGNGGASIATSSGNIYHSSPTSGAHYFRTGISNPVVAINTAFNPALIATASSGTSADVRFGSGAYGAQFGTTGPQVRAGAGSPEGAVTAPVGSVYHRSDGGTGTTYWIKESGVAATGWVAVVAATGITASLVDAKGDLIAATADNTVARHAAGTNGTVLVADSTQTTGLAWGWAVGGKNSIGLRSVVGRATAPGPPTSGTWATNDEVVDSLGVLWICTSGGTPGTWVSPLSAAPNWGSPLATGEANTDRRYISQSGSSGNSGDLLLVYFRATKTETISTIQMATTATAAAAQTSARMGVYSVAANGDLTRVARTADDPTLFTTTFAFHGRPLEASWAKAAGQLYATAVYTVATTRPTWVGAWGITGMGLQDTLNAVSPRLSGRVPAQTDLLASYTSAQVVTGRVVPYCEMYQ